MCAHCTFTGSMDNHVDGTILDRDLNRLFEGDSDEIMEWIMANPLLVCYVWIAGEGEPISIDEWTDWMDSL